MATTHFIYDNITTYLENFLNTNKETLSNTWKTLQKGDINKNQDPTKGKVLGVFRQIQPELVYLPSAEIVFERRETSIVSIGTQEWRFYYSIILSVESAHPTNSERYMTILSNSVMDLLNDFSNRSFSIPEMTGICAYYSEADSCQAGFRRGRGLYSSKISWNCKVLVANRF